MMPLLFSSKFELLSISILKAFVPFLKHKNVKAWINQQEFVTKGNVLFFQIVEYDLEIKFKSIIGTKNDP